MLRLLVVLAGVTAFSMCNMLGAADGWTLSSPDGQVSVTVQMARLGGVAGYPQNKERLYYRVECAKGAVLDWSPLGIMRQDQAFLDGLSFVEAGEATTIEEAYVMPHGKQRQCCNHANEQVLSFKNTKGAKLDVVLRAYNDGIAFRYRFPEESNQKYTVIWEATGFQLPLEGKVWMHPYDKSGQYTPSYETYYVNEARVGTASPNQAGWAFPVLFRNSGGDRWGLITESGLDGTYCGCRLEQMPARTVYRLRFPDAAEGNHTGQVQPSWTLPWATPWRVVMAGTSPARIVESTMVTDLNPPSIVKDTSWIKPGRASWSWLSDHDSPQDFNKLKPFVDLAAEMGWEYSLVDANWTIMKNGTIHDLLAHAKAKGVGLLMWYNSGGPHNFVSEMPRGMMYFQDIRRKEFKRLQEWGVKGVKVDFFQSDKQAVIGLYHDILKDAADFQIMVNFHGCTLPRGWSRTYPHLMTMEAVCGEEQYSFRPVFPEQALEFNTIVPFTRNAVGPMDYTPVMFENIRYPHLTTGGHELALSVVFESGWLHFADRVDAYLNLPAEPKAFLCKVPVAWEQSRLLDGYPGRYVVLARQAGGQWYVAGINGQKKPQSAKLDLSFLAKGAYTITVITDGMTERSFTTQSQSVKGGNTINLTMQSCGGFVATLKAEK